MSEMTKNKYTLETLLPLNVSYDRDHILRQQDVDMVNRLVEVIEGSRSNLTPKVGDRMRHVDRDGDFYGHTLLEPNIFGIIVSKHTSYLSEKLVEIIVEIRVFLSLD